MAASFGPVVDARWLRAHADGLGVRVLDCRWTLGIGSRPDLYAAGHIPGAVFVDLERDLTAPPGRGGRHPLPDHVDFEQAMRRAGVEPGAPVVAYDEGSGAAARCWWMLRASGHGRAAVLDGGLDAWFAAGGPLTMTTSASEPGRVVLGPFRGTVDADTVAQLAEAAGGRAAPVLDARAPERYRGEEEPIDPRAGHIPGARNLAHSELFPGGHLLDPAALTRRLAAAGVVPGSRPVAYCGSGISACRVLLAIEVAGIGGGRLYPGSWSEWSQQSDRPVAVGSDRQGRRPG